MLNFFFPPLGEGCALTQLGDYWLELTPQPIGPAVALIAEREAEREDLELLAVPVQFY